jgi:hypothetical protein
MLLLLLLLLPLLLPASVSQAAGRPPSPIHGPNPWPDQVPGFTQALKTYISHMQALGAALLRGIAMGLQLPPDTFAGDFAGPEGSYWVGLMQVTALFVCFAGGGGTHTQVPVLAMVCVFSIRGIVCAAGVIRSRCQTLGNTFHSQAKAIRTMAGRPFGYLYPHTHDVSVSTVLQVTRVIHYPPLAATDQRQAGELYL